MHEVGVVDTPHEYRARAVTLKESGEVLYRSSWRSPRAVLAKGAGMRDVIENAIGTAQILPNAVTVENFNVLAKSAVNSFAGGTKEGWKTNGEIVEDAGEGLPVLEIPADDAQAASNEFDALPESIYEAKFGFRAVGDLGIGNTSTAAALIAAGFDAGTAEGRQTFFRRATRSLTPSKS